MTREARTLGDESSPASAGNVLNVQVGYKRTEAGVIPEGWRISTVGEEFRVQLGKMLDAAKNTGASKPYIGNRSVQWGRIDLADIDTVPMTSTDLRRFRLRLGDLLVCEGGEIGRSAIWEEPIRECYFQKALHRLRSIRGYDSYLMMSLLQLWASTGYLTTYVTQTSIAHLPKDKLETVPLPVPTAAEQRAIAAVLSDVDELIGSLEALVAKKRAIKQAAMQELLTGRTRLPGFGREWEMVALGEIGKTYGGLTGKDSADFGEGHARYISFLDVLEQVAVTWRRFDHVRVSTSESQNRVLSGDVLFNATSETPEDLAMGSMVLVDSDELYLNSFCFGFRIANCNRCDPLFLAYFSRGIPGRKAMYALAQGATRYNLSKKRFLRLVFPLPPLPEQRAIATILSDMDAEIAAQERRLVKTRAIKQGMMQQLLTGSIRLPIPATSVEGEADP